MQTFLNKLQEANLLLDCAKDLEEEIEPFGKVALAQWRKGTTRRGHRWSLSSAKPFLDSDGKDVTLPLKLGCEYCLVHLPLLIASPRRVADTLVLYFDFETSGLDVLSDQSKVKVSPPSFVRLC